MIQLHLLTMLNMHDSVHIVVRVVYFIMNLCFQKANDDYRLPTLSNLNYDDKKINKSEA